MSTIEKQVANTILEKKETVSIAGEKYKVPPPSYATLILFSEFISELPNEELDTQRPLASLLSQSKKLENVCKAIACIVIGAKEFYTEISFTTSKKSFFSLFQKKKKATKTKGEILTEKILHTDIEEISKNFIELLQLMKLHDFFQLTTSLIEMNITKPTAEVETKTTARGQ